MAESRIQQKRKRLVALDQERSSWVPHWRELSENFLPRRGRALFGQGANANKGEKRNMKLVDGTPAYAVRTLASGMMAGLTSPTRPWFRLTTPDPEMMEYKPVSEWLFTVQNLMLTRFSKSNFYNMLYAAYGDLAVFGTFAAVLLEDERDTIRAYTYSPGRYYLAASARGEIDTLPRTYPMTVRALVDTFGRDKCSPRVRAHYDKSEYDVWIEVCHFIEPNTQRDVRKYDNLNMPYYSCYFEKDSNEDRFLSESGFEEYPGLTPRWDVPDEDVYGSSPAMFALGDAKALQLQQKRKAQAIDKLVEPPMVASPELKNQRASLLPGDVTYTGFSNTGGAPGFQPAYVIKPEIQALLEDIRETKEQIRRAMYEDLFLMFTLSDRREITAKEITEKQGEKLLMLGPVLERLSGELLDQGIDRTFYIMLRKGQLPPPPPELSDSDLKVEYISVLAQAQRMVATDGIERLIGFAASLAPVYPDVMDKVDVEEAVEAYGNALGTQPSLVRSDEETAQLRSKRDQEKQAMMAAQAAQPAAQLAGAAKDLSETPLNSSTALQEMVGG